jgi:membrane-bound metal-dependent hydrolase YbcI (DUF457 family)
VWPIFLLLGIEHVRITPGDTAFTPLEFTHYPYTHSLVYVIGWGVLLGGVCFFLKRSWRDAAVVGLVVISHWILDWLSHRPDLPLYPGSEPHGLGLWHSVSATIAVEGMIFLAGVAIYAWSTRARGRVGVWLFWGLVVALIFFYVMNIVGPPPPSETALGWFALAAWIFPVWGYWIDRHRTTA